jgi:hypothetical protein
MTEDYLSYYDLETYLFNTIHARFHKEQKLDSFDLFSIIIWKANRSKSKLAHRLIKKTRSLDAAADQFTHALFEADSHEARLKLAMESWGFYLPMASAILTVLWPDDFTVFDSRVCQELSLLKLGDFSNLGNLIVKNLWPKYCAYCEAVKKAVPQYSSLRDKDRFLWGQSAARQLVIDVKNGFLRNN